MSDKKYVVLHHALAWQHPAKDEQGQPLKTPEGAPMVTAALFRRGDVVPAHVFEGQDLGRLRRLKALREANEDEAGLERVSLPEGGDLAASAEALLAQKERELGDMRTEASRRDAELSALRANMTMAQPDPAQLPPAAQERVAQLNREVEQLKAEATEWRRRLAEAQSGQPSPPQAPQPQGQGQQQAPPPPERAQASGQERERAQAQAQERAQAQAEESRQQSQRKR